MGDDAPLAVLSERPRPLSAYFRQRFAQVTNPPIDSLRERKVMALDTYIGPRGNLLVEDPRAGRADPPAERRHRPKRSSTRSRRSISGRLQARRRSRRSSPCQRRTAGWRALTRARPIVADGRSGGRDGATVIVLSDRGIDASTRRADAAGGRRGPSRPDPRRAAHAGRSRLRDRRGLGRPPARLPDRLRRVGGPSVPGAAARPAASPARAATRS